MPKPRNDNRIFTPIMITKVDKNEFRKFAQATKHPNRKKGNESDTELFHRMLEFIKQNWTAISNVPTPTYIN